MTRHVATWDVVGVGANAVDHLYVVPTYPDPHGPVSKVRFRRRLVCGGGQTATAMATCAALGLRAKYVGAVGTDENGQIARQALFRCGMDCTDVIVRDAANQFAVIVMGEADGERAIIWNRDERLRIEPGELPAAAIQSARVVHVDDVDAGAALQAARLSREAGGTVTSDFDHVAQHTEALLAAVSIPILSENLPGELTGGHTLERALMRLKAPHHRFVCVTRGPRGALAYDGRDLIVSPGFVVQAVDTTGAGDVFRGALIYGWLQEWPIDRVLRFANAAAAVSCTRLGALNGVPTISEIEHLLAEGNTRP